MSSSKNVTSISSKVSELSFILGFMASSSVLEVLLGVLLTTVEFDSSSVFEVSLLHPIAIIKKTKKQREKDLIFDI
jgi:hypothetical protein